jgi:hypothetical protein
MRLREQEKQEPAFDETNKIFFEKPTVLKIGEPAVTTMPNPVFDSANGIKGPIRTKSCRETFGDKIEVQYQISQYPSKSDVEEYFVRNQIHGYGEGSIVARRWANGVRFLYPHQWGVIIHLNRYPGISADYAPYQIRWFSSEKPLENAWGEDLFVVHACLDRDLLLDIAEAQGVDITEAAKVVRDMK